MLHQVNLSRAQWLEKFETECIKLSPKVKVDFGAGRYWYYKGLSPEDAADAWINRKVLA